MRCDNWTVLHIPFHLRSSFRVCSLLLIQQFIIRRFPTTTPYLPLQPNCSSLNHHTAYPPRYTHIRIRSLLLLLPHQRTICQRKQNARRKPILSSCKRSCQKNKIKLRFRATRRIATNKYIRRRWRDFLFLLPTTKRLTRGGNVVPRGLPARSNPNPCSICCVCRAQNFVPKVLDVELTGGGSVLGTPTDTHIFQQKFITTQRTGDDTTTIAFNTCEYKSTITLNNHVCSGDDKNANDKDAAERSRLQPTSDRWWGTDG